MCRMHYASFSSLCSLRVLVSYIFLFKNKEKKTSSIVIIQSVLYWFIDSIPLAEKPIYAIKKRRKQQQRQQAGKRARRFWYSIAGNNAFKTWFLIQSIRFTCLWLANPFRNVEVQTRIKMKIECRSIENCFRAY